MVIEGDEQSYYDYIVDSSEVISADGRLESPPFRPDELDSFIISGPDLENANRTTQFSMSGHLPAARNAPPYSYATAISSARVPLTASAQPFSLAYSPGSIQPTSSYSQQVPPESGRTSLYSSDNSPVISAHSSLEPAEASQHPHHQQPYVGQGETSFGDYVSPMCTQAYTQPAFEYASYASWGGDASFNDGINTSPTTTGGMNLSLPAAGITTPAIARRGSFESIGGSPEGDRSGSEINFGGTSGLTTYGASGSGSASLSPKPSQHKRAKKSPEQGATRQQQAARRSSLPTRGSGGSSGSRRELRSASRTSKNARTRPAETAEERKSRNSHNLVEKQYRNRLNAQFESLLNSLPDTIRSPAGLAAAAAAFVEGLDDGGDGAGIPMDFGEKRVSKAEVLEMARGYIKSLEKDRDSLERERNELLETLERLREAYSKVGDRDGRTLDDEVDILRDGGGTRR